jgi:mRNA interferase MazF
MGTFIKGDVVVIPFPFSDLSASKRRPALVIADLPGDDVILCQITSKNVTNTFALALTSQDFADGGLHQERNIRPERLFTADSNLVLYRAGSVLPNKIQEVIDIIVHIVQS